MRISLIRFYWLKIFGAVLALFFAILYLSGVEGISFIGFSAIALVTVVITVRISRNTMPAVCDLCRSPGTMAAEYGAGYANARLILHCPKCGRVINGEPGSMAPRKE